MNKKSKVKKLCNNAKDKKERKQDCCKVVQNVWNGKETSRKKQDFVQQKMDLKSGVKSTPTVKCFPIFEKFSAILLQKIFIKSLFHLVIEAFGRGKTMYNNKHILGSQTVTIISS